MKTRQLLFTLVMVGLLVSCKSHEPFASAKEKRIQKRLIQEKFNLNAKEFAVIKNEDSILFEISESIKKDVKFETTNRRIDSFLKGVYPKKGTLLILQLDQLKMGEFDFVGSDENTDHFKKFETIAEIEKFLNELETSMTIKVDSIVVKKQ